jgi:hypothetical protein
MADTATGAPAKRGTSLSLVNAGSKAKDAESDMAPHGRRHDLQDGVKAPKGDTCSPTAGSILGLSSHKATTSTGIR